METRNNQIPRNNDQTIINNQISIIKQNNLFGYWNLRFGICLYLVSWLLVISSLLVAFPVYALSLKEAQEDYLIGNYEEAISKAQRLRETDQVLYFLGLVYIKTTDYPKARIYLQKLTDRFPESSFYIPGLLKLADAYFLQGDYEESEKFYKEVTDKHAGADELPLAFLRLAQIASRKGDWEQKAKYIERIKKKYPKSNIMNFVEILESYGDFFTIQVGAFSEVKNARALREDLRQKYDPYIVEDKNGNYLLHKVRVGRFKERFDAEKIAQQLHSDGYPARIYP